MNDMISTKLNEILATNNFGLLAPHLIVSIGAVILMLVSVMSRNAFRNNAVLAIAILCAAFYFALPRDLAQTVTAFNSMVLKDFFSSVEILLFTLTGILVVLISHNYLKKRSTDIPEYYSLLLFAISGMMFMASSADLIMVYIGIEVLSVALYVMAAIDTKDINSTEAGIKYFLMSVFASAFLLFGIAFIYGSVGSTSFSAIKDFAMFNGFNSSHFLYAGVLLILAGMAFKISLAPFHLWTPDVYQGAPLSVTAFLSTGPKIAVFAFLFRFFYQFQNVQPYPELLQDIVVALAVITMIVGNLLALNQEDVKRMLAFSSVTHMGYVMTAFTTHSTEAVSSAMFYFTAYIFMNLGSFALLSVISRDNDKNLNVENFKGMAAKKPLLAFLFMIFLLSLAGIPPMIGFAAKFFIFSSVIHAHMYLLAIIGILNSAVSAYYYLRIIVNMYLKTQNEDTGNNFKEINFAVPEITVVAISFLAVIFLGLQPSFLIQWLSKIVI
ncbi:MAG: NADH-quinone oxidoreductase subunit N [Spirochaetia bacterium]|nr:NADH-quinone oxidoreductase subunit N [Spirochaetia bacterium]